MDDSRSIRAILEDPKFEAVENYIYEMRKEWIEEARKEKDTVELTGMNTIKFGAMATAATEILEALYEKAGRELKEKTDNVTNKDYE